MTCRTKMPIGVLAAILAAMTGPARSQNTGQDPLSHLRLTVYVQAADARFDSYLYVEKTISADHETNRADEFFFIPRATSRDREKEFANWRRQFNLIVSAATLSDRVQPKITHIKEEFSKAAAAAECWTVDRNRERRITITVIGSASEALVENEYKAASREFLANPRTFTCKYAYRPDAALARPPAQER